MYPYIKRDLFLMHQIKTNPTFQEKLNEAIEICQVLNIQSKASFILYSSLEQFKELKYEDLFYFERRKNKKYNQILNKIYFENIEYYETNKPKTAKIYYFKK